MATVAGCLDIVGEFKSPTKAALTQICGEMASIIVTSGEWDESLEYYLESSVHVNDISGFNNSGIVTAPVRLDKDYVELWHRSYINWLINNYDNTLWLSLLLVWWMLTVMVAATVLNWSKIWFPSVYVKLSGHTSNWIRKKLLLPALWGQNKSEEKTLRNKKFFSMLLPTRAETMVLLLLGLVNVFIYTNNLHFIENDPLFKTKIFAYSRYLATRSGIAGTMLTPLVILFAGRNNTLMWLTGWNYASLITYHKWISRIAFLNIYIHSVIYAQIFIKKGRYEELSTEWYLIWGVAGTRAMVFIIMQAVLYLRRKWYEVFVCLHIFLAFIYIVGSWYHLEPLGYLYLVLPSIIFWGFDRVMRLSKIVRFGFPFATVKVVGEVEDITIKVLIPKPKNWECITGGFIWIYFLNPRWFWQSHPFTCLVEKLDDEQEFIVLYCKVKEGVTDGLYKQILQMPMQEGKIRVAVEGPYVEPCQYHHTHNVTFIAGGSGIPGLYSEAKALAQNKSRDQTKIIRLLWIIKTYESIEWFSRELMTLKDSGVEVVVYVTRHSKVGQLAEESGESEIDGLKARMPFVRFIEKRPNLDEIVNEDVVSRSVGFVVCGHPRMVDEVRAIVAKSLDLHRGQRLDFHESLQVWT